MKLLASLICGVFLSMAVAAGCFGGVVNLPWSSSLNCANWENVVNGVTPSCTDFIRESDNYACGHYSMITTAANRPGSAGGGIRQLVAPGDNNQTIGLDIQFASAQSSIWIRWYEKYAPGFAFSTLNYHKDIYLVDYTGGKTNQYLIPEPYMNTYRVGWWDNVSGISNVIYGNSTGWSTVGDGNWHLYELHVTQSGTIQMWIDEQQIINGTTGRAFPYGWGLVLFGSNFSTVSSNCLPVDYDDISISNTGYIGPAGSGSSGSVATPTGFKIGS